MTVHLNTAPGVLLVSMPWALLNEPPLGVSILKAILRRKGIPCRVLNANMRLLRHLKETTYKSAASLWALNSLVFTREFEDSLTKGQLELIPQILRTAWGLMENHKEELTRRDGAVQKILRLRNDVIPRYLDELMEEVDWAQYSLVGFSCLFDQTISSLALARRIKAAFPNIMIAFGGAAIGVKPVGPALQKGFSEIDVLCYGDGEPAIVPLYQASVGEVSLADVPNISYRSSSGQLLETATERLADLDSSPTPDYDDWFVDRMLMWKSDQIRISVGEVPVESSRGCWWGQKRQCVFCGIDDSSRAYRRKSGNVFLEQLRVLKDRYGVDRFLMTDYIMPRESYRELLPVFERMGVPYRLYWETRSKLTVQEIAQCARSGVHGMQPGIESFSSRVLRRMNKGVSGAQNIFTIYTMMRHHIFCFYNIIWGFPGDEPEDYRQMARIVPALYHFMPPATVVPVMINRFAPLCEQPQLFGKVGPLSAHPHYEVVFSEEFLTGRGLKLENWVYYFDDAQYRDFSVELQASIEVLQHQVHRWRERFLKRACLGYQLVNGGIVFHDTRHDDVARSYSFGQLHRAICEKLIGSPFREADLIRKLPEIGGGQSKVTAALSELCEARVIVEEGGRYVFVALPQSYYDAGDDKVLRDPVKLYDQFSNTCTYDSCQWGDWGD